MNPALHRPPANTARTFRSSFTRWQVPRGWAEPAKVSAAAARVLDEALDTAQAGPQAMRSGARVTVLKDDRFETALRLYREGHWGLAFDALATLADQDHATAAKLALLMLRYGSTLFLGATFSAQPVQVARWAQRVLSADGRDAPPHSSRAAAPQRIRAQAQAPTVAA
jgi:hypothetical protein